MSRPSLIQKALCLIVNPPPVFFVLALVILDAILSTAIIKKIPYTEIDWIAYMQEVQGFLDGERNYFNLKGDTGPLVYPAGFLYVFAFLRQLTDSGANIFKGVDAKRQVIFAGVYLLNLAVVLVLYVKGIRSGLNASLWITTALILSKRIHSIYMLRMFNDCIAVLLGYIAILLFTNHKWRIGSVFFSLAVSVKMNMLLQAPGLLMLYLMALGPWETFLCLCICASVQLLLGLPFLLAFPREYVQRSFDLGRVFMFKWTVNLKFLPEEVFVGKPLSIGLLLLTVAAMSAFAWKWNHAYRKASLARREQSKVAPRILSSHFIVATLFTSNFIGVVFARSLHYQFYCWYFHTLPYLLWSVSLPSVVRVAILVAVEVAFNVYPATWWSSAVLQVAHGILLLAIFWSKTPDPFITVQTVTVPNKAD